MQTGTRSRGFASMDTEKQREIARKGGKAAHAKGTAHEFTADEARAAGRKGGERVSSNREHMSRIGRIGGKSSASRRQPTDADNGNGSPDTTGHASPEQPSTAHPGNGEGHRGEEVRGASTGSADTSGAAEPASRSSDVESGNPT
jgi:general stress protein YciG